VVVRGEVEGTDFSAFFVRDGVLRGAVTMGRPADVRAARMLVADRARVDTAKLADSAVPVGLDTLARSARVAARPPTETITS
jgi:3-phenylpropionate/trans-cinnamate dioxygenase ferredoxin reductase subunit